MIARTGCGAEPVIAALPYLLAEARLAGAHAARRFLPRAAIFRVPADLRDPFPARWNDWRSRSIKSTTSASLGSTDAFSFGCLPFILALMIFMRLSRYSIGELTRIPCVSQIINECARHIEFRLSDALTAWKGGIGLVHEFFGIAHLSEGESIVDDFERREMLRVALVDCPFRFGLL